MAHIAKALKTELTQRASSNATTPESSSSNEPEEDRALTHEEYLFEQAAKRYENLLVQTDVPPRYALFRFETVYDALQTEGKADVWEMARAFVDEGKITQRGADRFCFFLTGSFGTGKTALATAMLKEKMWNRVAAGRMDAAGQWMKFYTFTRSVQSGYSDGTSDERLQAVQRVPLLLLDDVGDVERGKRETDDRRALLYEVLDYRNDHLLPTIMTTNLDMPGLVEAFGQRTWERVMEMCAMFEMKGENLRL